MDQAHLDFWQGILEQTGTPTTILHGDFHHPEHAMTSVQETQASMGEITYEPATAFPLSEQQYEGVVDGAIAAARREVTDFDVMDAIALPLKNGKGFDLTLSNANITQLRIFLGENLKPGRSPQLRHAPDAAAGIQAAP